MCLAGQNLCRISEVSSRNDYDVRVILAINRATNIHYHHADPWIAIRYSAIMLIDDDKDISDLRYVQKNTSMHSVA